MVKNRTITTFFLIALSTSTYASADWPIATPDNKTIHPIQFAADNYQVFKVLENDIGSNLRVVESNSWSKNGGRTFISFSGRAINYLPPADFVGEDSYWYVMEDDQGRKNAAEVTVTVKAADSRFPDPLDDQATVQKDKSIRIDVLKNDAYKGYVHIDKLTQFDEWSEKGGQIKLDKPSANAYPQLVYTPPPSFLGTDAFWYTIKSENAEEQIEHRAKVTIEVTEGNQAEAYPFANEDFVTLKEVTIPSLVTGGQFFVTSNDTGKNLKVDSNPWSLNGSSVLVSRRNKAQDTFISYIASSEAIELGEDKVWYTIEDEVGRKNWSVVNITLIAAE